MAPQQPGKEQVVRSLPTLKRQHLHLQTSLISGASTLVDEVLVQGDILIRALQVEVIHLEGSIQVKGIIILVGIPISTLQVVVTPTSILENSTLKDIQWVVSTQ